MNVALLPNVTIRGAPVLGFRFGEDSYYIENAISAQDYDVHSVPFQERNHPALYIRGWVLNRQKFFCYDPELKRQGLFPVYNYPGRQWGTVAMHSTWDAYPVIEELRDVIQTVVIDGEPVHKVNHCIGTLYKDGKDNISPHNDQPKDIQGNIYTFTFGASRELHFHWNENKDLRKPDIVLVPASGSLVILGPKINLAMKHSVPVTRLNKVMPKEDAGPRVSVIFRSVTRLLTKKQVNKAVASSEKSKVSRKRKRDELVQ
jgi:hypothetical protein